MNHSNLRSGLTLLIVGYAATLVLAAVLAISQAATFALILVALLAALLVWQAITLGPRLTAMMDLIRRGAKVAMEAASVWPSSSPPTRRHCGEK